MSGVVIPPLIRRVVMAAILAMAAIGVWAVGTHQLSYVITSGISMQPVYYAKDLVFIRPSNSYEIGQIAAYHGPGGVEVLHRIIGGDAETGFVLKGDNNQSIDVDKPTADQLIGRAALHVPRGGVWLGPLLSPTSLGIVGFLFVSGGTAAARNRREIARGRRKKKVKVRGMSSQGGSWAAATTVIKAVGRLHPAMRVVAALAVACGVLGVGLGVLGWMKPTSEAVAGTEYPGESMTFSYSAAVPRSAAYDGTTVYSPDPVFRRLAKVVNLQLSYRGGPGHIEVNGRLSAENGWHTALQFSQRKQFTTDRYTDTVQLDLDAMEQRAKAAGEAIGVDIAAVTVEVAVRVGHGDGPLFEPKILFNLAPVQLSLLNGPTALVVNPSTSASGSSVQTRYIKAFDYNLLSAANARRYAMLLLVAGVMAAGLVAMTALRTVSLRTRAQIQRRYPHLLVPVEPMASPPGKPVVVVDTFPALVKLAEKYGQMILTWTRPDGADDFVVRDEGILYRYRIEPDAVPASPAKPEVQPAASPASDGITPESGTAPVLQLPPPPETPPELQADGEVGEKAAAAEGTPVKKTAPRKRTSRTAAAKAAAKTTATKTTTAKSAPAKAPAKRTRAQAKSVPEPETTVATTPDVEVSADTSPDQPAPAAPDTEPVHASGADTGEPIVLAVTAEHFDADGSGEPTVDTGDSQVESFPATGPSDKTLLTDAEEKPESGIGAPLLAELDSTQLSPEPERVTADPKTLTTGAEEPSSDPKTPISESEEPAPDPASLTTEPEPVFGPKTLTADAEDPAPEAKALTAEREAPAPEARGLTAEPDMLAADTEIPTVETDPISPTPESTRTEVKGSREADRSEPEATVDATVEAARAEMPTAPESAEPQLPQAEAAEAPQSRSQKRATRRKSRSRRGPQPAVDESPAADGLALTDESDPNLTADKPEPKRHPESEQHPEPNRHLEPEQRPAMELTQEPRSTGEAREAMEDLVDRNRPIIDAELEPEAQPAAAPEPQREPIYDFLPPAKRFPAPPEPDDEPDA